MRKNFGAKPWTSPLPVWILAAYDKDGVPCCMNAAWGGISDDTQVSICVSPGHKTVKNILETGEFTVSMGQADQMVACDYVGIVSGNNVPDKFEKAGFHAEPAAAVNAPLIQELALAIECKLVSYDPETCLMVADIVETSIDESALDAQGSVDLSKVRPLAYDPYTHNYNALGDVVGKAFHDGGQLK